MITFHLPQPWLRQIGLCLLMGWLPTSMSLGNDSDRQDDSRSRPDQRLIQEYCFDCHGDGAAEGGVALDELLESNDLPAARKTWERVLRQLRADLMPPIDETQPSANDLELMESWIIQDALDLNPDHPNPGKVTVRRLNRVEYRNTIRDLIGVDFNTSIKFPADDTGHGFDNMADVLSISPLLLEKYFNAAREIIGSVVPTESRIVRVNKIRGSQFKPKGEKTDGVVRRRGRLEFSYYSNATATTELKIDTAGPYQLKLSLIADEDFIESGSDLNTCELTCLLDNKELLKQSFARHGGKDFTFDFDQHLTEGTHSLEVRIKPTSDTDQVRRLRIVLESVELAGPLMKEHYRKPKGYDQFFPRNVPTGAEDRRTYAKELLGTFAERAFRRPVDEKTLERLADLAESTYSHGEATFEKGIAKSMTAILASPRFVFREEFPLENDDSEFPLIDEHSLASRLSYFLWSSMPDDELIQAADAGQLRATLDDQISRMMADKKFEQLVRNFVGQWLQARSIQEVPISARSVLRRESPPQPKRDQSRKRLLELRRKGDDRNDAEEQELKRVTEELQRSRRGPSIDLTGEIRRAMRQETELFFEFIVRNDRSLLELIDSDYTFLNNSLAKYYQLDDVPGRQMQRVVLPAESVRGGILTQGTVLAVTSNPGRTSPVKRGLFILENVLGTPTAAPPPDIPALKETSTNDSNAMSLRETLEIHRQDPNCSSCHNRMDPLGLALENFNALGRYREQELGQPIDAKGVLITGEAFENVRQLKKILTTTRKSDFYRCLTEKMLTYALGRAVDYSDIPTVDMIVDSLNTNDGQATMLLKGIIHSSAFQRTLRRDFPIQNGIR